MQQYETAALLFCDVFMSRPSLESASVLRVDSGSLGLSKDPPRRTLTDLPSLVSVDSRHT